MAFPKGMKMRPKGMMSPKEMKMGGLAGKMAEYGRQGKFKKSKKRR